MTFSRRLPMSTLRAIEPGPQKTDRTMTAEDVRSLVAASRRGVPEATAPITISVPADVVVEDGAADVEGCAEIVRHGEEPKVGLVLRVGAGDSAPPRRLPRWR